ncbi:MAG: hypothetical protein ACOY3P_02405 [Planctomycetota bacterium]
MPRSWKSGRWIELLAVVGSVLVVGCAWQTGIDPTGQRIFSAPPPPPGGPPPSFSDEPGGQLPWDDVAVSLCQQELAAPVGSEVILVAGVLGSDNYLRTNRRLEWSVAPGSVGHFISVGQGDWRDWFVGDFTNSRKIDATYAVGSTLRSNIRLHRGTPTPEDDVHVLAGQGWVSVTSPVEGTSRINVHAPEVYPWDGRTRTATIHWVDSTYRFPAPAIAAAGTRQTLTTTVLRQTDQSPSAGWLVRYEIAGGPPAGFSPAGATSIEVPTDSTGNATAEIFQKQPQPGTNNVRIQILRPGSLPGADGRQMVVGNGTAMVTWTAPSLAIQKSGPAVATLGATLTFRTTVSNPGDQPAQDVIITEDVPEGASYVRSNPPAEVTGRRLTWQLGALGPGQSSAVEVDFKAERTGSISSCATVNASPNLRASNCATTTVASAPTTSQPSILVQLSGPTQARVGERVKMQINIVNRGNTPAAQLTVKDQFDVGLQHVTGSQQIEQTLPSLAAGASQPLDVEFTVTRAGRLCHRVEVVDAQNRSLAREEGCITGIAATPPPGSGAAAPTAPGVGSGAAGPEPPAGRELPGLSSPPTAPPGPTTPARSPLLVRVTGPREKSLGDEAEFTIEIVNQGSQPLTNVRLVIPWDTAAVVPVQAFGGHKVEGNTLVGVVPQLMPGRTEEFGVLYRCKAPSVRSCQRVQVTTAEGVRAEGEACMIIRATPGIPGAAAPTTPPRSDASVPGGAGIARGTPSPPAAALPGTGPITPPTPATSRDRPSGIAGAAGGTSPPPLAPAPPDRATTPEPWPGALPPDSLGSGVPDRYALPPGMPSGGMPPSGTALAPAPQPPARPGAGAEPPPAGPSPLRVDMADLVDPIPVGQMETYEIRVRNTGQAIERFVSLSVVLPPGMAPSPLGTTGPMLSRAAFDRQEVSFSAVPEIRAGEEIVYRLRAKATQPGTLVVAAEATSPEHPEPIRAETTTEVAP